MAKKPVDEEALEELDHEIGESEDGGMVSLKKSAEQKKKEKANMSGPVMAGTGDEYDYGTRLQLNKDLLERLGIKELPKVGDKFSVEAVAEVVSVSQNSGKDSENREVSLQLTDMKVEDK